MSIHRILVTPGEPAGVGPDITLAAAQGSWPAQLVAIADPDLLADRAQRLGLEIDLELVGRPFLAAEPAPHRSGSLPVLPLDMAKRVIAGRPETANADYVLECLTQATNLCKEGQAAAMVTGPVQKSTIADSGIPFSGHTEFLAQITATSHVVMMLTCPQFRVALATTHIPLSEVASTLNTERLITSLTVIDRDLRRRFGIANPRIAVLGLNPHAGENGHLGSEEQTVIEPAIRHLQVQGMDILGPLPADTAFNPDVIQEVDLVFAMYHDQALPVLKFAGFGNSVNITLGLPIVRTSVDHGTALQLAGTGKANAGSMIAAIEAAIGIADTNR